MSDSNNSRRNLEIVVVIITIVGVIVAILAWLTPFNPVGQSPLLSQPQASVLLTPSFICRPLLLSENFDSATDDYKYLHGQKAVIQNGRLRFVIDLPRNGKSFPLYGQYEQFVAEFSAFPVGEIFDGSINILFLQHAGGGYEYQIRPRYNQFQFLRVMKQSGQQDKIEGIGWTQSSAVTFGADATIVRLDVQVGEFTLWVNNEKVHTFKDADPYLRGELYVGAGAGEVAPITVDIDNIKICGQ